MSPEKYRHGEYAWGGNGPINLKMTGPVLFKREIFGVKKLSAHYFSAYNLSSQLPPRVIVFFLMYAFHIFFCKCFDLLVLFVISRLRIFLFLFWLQTVLPK